MSLDWLQATRFRNLTHLEFSPTPGINILTGANGSGKTSILECCYYLATGRSFRSNQVQPLVQRNQSNFLLRGRVSTDSRQHQIGITRDLEGNREIRIDGENAHKTSQLASLIPVLELGPESVDLLLGSPANRRRFLNWGLFHVEQSFVSIWEEANRALRQRNQVLKDGGVDSVLATWTERLVHHTKEIDRSRVEFVDQYQPVFTKTVEELSGLDEVGFQYHPGWDRGRELTDIYAKDIEIDRKKGFTNKGFQRADVRITVAGEPATKVCSRGELKAIVWAMYLAQGAFLKAETGSETLYLVDDLASEFDEMHRRRLAELLIHENNQVVVTGVDKAQLLEAFSGLDEASRDHKKFHVKHFEVKAGTVQPDG